MWPDRNSQAELDSLTFQCSRRRVVPAPEEENLSRAVEAVSCRYGERIRLPNYLETMDIYSQKFDIAVAGMMADIQGDGSPGVPLKSVGSFNKDVLDKNMFLYKGVLKDRLQLLKDTPTEELRKLSAKELVQRGFVDPVRLFVKNEPHTKVKADAKRWRLIHSVSLVDQSIERLLFNHINKKEISRWANIPSKPGMGFSEVDVEKVIRNFEELQKNGPVAASDVEGFDFSFQGWAFDADVRIRLLLHDTDLTGTHYERMLYNRAYCISMSVFQLSDGHLFEQLQPGIQKSGSLNTSSTNSRIRVLQAELVGAAASFAAGDDCDENWVEDAREKYLKLGVKLKFYEKIEGDTFEFCSHIYNIKDRSAYSTGLTKETMKFLCKKDTLEHRSQWDSYKMQWSNDLVGNPLSEEAVDVMAAIGRW